MGTSGLLGFILKGGRKKASYNPSDSYPIGLGRRIMEWLTSLTDEQIEEMTSRVEEVEW